MFVPGQLRTLQRRVKDWCCLGAHRLILVDPPNRDVDPDVTVNDSRPLASASLTSKPSQNGTFTSAGAC